MFLALLTDCVQCHVLADIATLQETVKQHNLRITSLDQTAAKGLDSVLKNLAEISRKFDSPSPPSRGGPPRRSFGPRRNLSDVTCYTCGAKGHYARDCKGTSWSSLPVKKQEEVQAALQHAPIGEFTMAVVWEQYAPNDSSQSLDEALDNLHRWSFGGPVRQKTVKLQSAALPLTAFPQVEAPPPPTLPVFEVTPPSLPTFAYSGMPLRGATSSCLPSLAQVPEPKKLKTGWSVKFPAVPENSVSGSTLEAPSYGGKKRGHGTSGRFIARPERRGGSFEHPVRPLIFKRSSLSRRRMNAPCFRPVVGESYKFEDPPVCSRMFQKKSSHEEIGKKQMAAEDASRQEGPFVEGVQSPLPPGFVQNSSQSIVSPSSLS